MDSTLSPSVLVTGATSGIGQAIARGFAANGEQVLAVGLGTLPTAEKNLAYASLDVQDAEAVTALLSSLDKLRVVVNAAGIIRREAEHDPAVFQQVVDINLTGTMIACDRLCSRRYSCQRYRPRLDCDAADSGPAG